MRYLTLSAAILAATTAMTAAPVMAEGDFKIVDKPLELKIQMNHKRYPRYMEDWPVEQAARAMTNIHLKDATVGSNTMGDENSGKTEALNLMLTRIQMLTVRRMKFLTSHVSGLSLSVL